MFVEVSYVSASCNQTNSILDWGKNNLICYGSSNSVLIYDYAFGGGKITDTLVGHTGAVKVVKWIKGSNYEDELVSGSVDKNVIVWSFTNDLKYKQQLLTGHSGVVTAISCMYKDVKAKQALIASSAFNTVIVWQRLCSQETFYIFQTINMGYDVLLSLCLQPIPDSRDIVLAISTNKSNIILYTQEGDEFKKQIELPGHDDWVRGLDFTTVNGYLLLASCSQDTFIRLWKFIPESEYNLTNDNQNTTHNKISTTAGSFVISVESVLMGHEGWVYSASWSPTGTKLLTCSLDKMMIIWEYDGDLNVWMETIKVGEIGGNILGFYGGMFGPTDDIIIGHGYNGAFHIWKMIDYIWTPQLTLGGHFAEVIDLGWDPEGQYLMSISYDQTTRIHAPWRKDDDSEVTWHEIARPQVHGYDMSCLAILGKYKFASGAEEKIIRVFEAPQNFIHNFRRICNLKKTKFEYNAPKGASVPSLGLSNKAVFGKNNDDATTITKNQPFPEESHFTSVDLSEPPTEETLLQNTLWPEVQKLYGHGYEVYCLAASFDYKILASACKSKTTKHSAIILWETNKWQIIQKIESHTLTVVQLAFSPNNKFLLSVSRDRRFTLLSKNSEKSNFQIIATCDMKTSIHTRIIWTCAWSHDSEYFATGSRDGKVVVWMQDENKIPVDVLNKVTTPSEILNLHKESVTALAFAPAKLELGYFLAVGLESGVINLYIWNKSGFSKVLHLNSSCAHHLSVRKLQFRPISGRAGFDNVKESVGRAGFENIKETVLQLASCGSDYSVKIFDINTVKIKPEI